MSYPPRPLAERFWEKVQRGEGCWLWVGARRDRNGYGRFKVNKVTIEAAHRMAWLLDRGEIPSGLHVLHHCDNPPCVRPDHLFLGTPLDNARDRSAKGRNAKQERRAA